MKKIILMQHLLLQIGFANKTAWARNYGGYAWEKIARSLKSLAIIKSGMIAAKKENNLELELDFMKQAIIELNVFDGLAHNTNSIMKNIIELENQSYGYSDDYEVDEER